MVQKLFKHFIWILKMEISFFGNYFPILLNLKKSQFHSFALFPLKNTTFLVTDIVIISLDKKLVSRTLFASHTHTQIETKYNYAYCYFFTLMD